MRHADVPMPPAWTVIGPESPRLAITEFSDTLRALRADGWC
jgi:hypothetical protein